MKKKSKLLFSCLISFSGLSAIFTPSVAKKSVIVNEWYDNLKSEIFEIRKQPITVAQNSNNHIVDIQVNNYFELKLLLNPGFETENEEFITKFNNDFINKVNKNNLIYKNFNTISILPIVWFYFDTEQDRKHFVTEVYKWNIIYKFIIFENKFNNINSTNIDPVKPFDKEPEEVESPKSVVRLLDDDRNIDLNLKRFIDSINKNANIVNASNHLNNSYVNKIGVLEWWSYPFDTNYQKYFKNGIEINDLNAEKNPNSKTHLNWEIFFGRFYLPQPYHLAKPNGMLWEGFFYLILL